MRNTKSIYQTEIPECLQRVSPSNDKYTLEQMQALEACTPEQKVAFLMRELCNLTPGGSEFVFSPFSCLRYLKKARWAQTHKIEKLWSEALNQVEKLQKQLQKEEDLILIKELEETLRKIGEILP